MRPFLVLALTLLCGGCALTTAKIDVPYQPLAQAVPVQGANVVKVRVSVIDGRTTNQDRVSVKKNGYGMEMAPIVATNNIPDTVKSAFEQELTARGFKLGQGGAKLHVELTNFYSDFKPGFFSADTVANVAFNTEILGSNQNIVFTKFYQANGEEPNVEIMGGENARAALIKAFQNAVASAVNDPDFINALISAGKVAQ